MSRSFLTLLFAISFCFAQVFTLSLNRRGGGDHDYDRDHNHHRHHHSSSSSLSDGGDTETSDSGSDAQPSTTFSTQTSSPSGGYETTTTPVVGTTPSPSAPAGNSTSPSSTASGSIWQPSIGATWQIELSTTPTTNEVSSSSYSIYDLDLFDTPADVISAIKSANKYLICYFSAGSYESGRPDSSSIPSSAIGAQLEGWPEQWLDYRTQEVKDVMAGRIKTAASKDCDAVDPDNMDGDTHDGGGFATPLTSEDAVAYVKFLSDTAHGLGLSIGLKNAGGIVGSAEPMVDFAVNEECLQYTECATWQTGFIAKGKAVFHIEYSDGGVPDANQGTVPDDCTGAGESGFSTLLKTEDLDATTYACPSS